MLRARRVEVLLHAKVTGLYMNSFRECSSWHLNLRVASIKVEVASVNSYCMEKL